MKKAFVTGATGFTGGYLCKHLRKKDYQVTALVRDTEKGKDLEKIGVILQKGDLAQAGSLTGLLKNQDLVFHIAALYRQEGVSREMFTRVNVNATKKLLDEAVAAKVKKFVHCSTVGVQGDIKDPPAKETAPYNPGDHYQESKLKGEEQALAYFKSGKIDGVVVRPVGIYGPGDTRFLKLFRHIAKGNFRMIGKGNVLYHLTFVEDLVAGIILAAESPESSCQIYTLGGKEYLLLNDLVKMLAEILNKSVSKIHIPLAPVYLAAFLCEMVCKPLRLEPPIYRRRLDFFSKDRAFDISKAQQELGYKPIMPLKQGLQITADWYREKGLLN